MALRNGTVRRLLIEKDSANGVAEEMKGHRLICFRSRELDAFEVAEGAKHMVF